MKVLYIAAKKPTLIKKYLKVRLSWTKSYELRDTDALNKIIFND